MIEIVNKNIETGISKILKGFGKLTTLEKSKALDKLQEAINEEREDEVKEAIELWKAIENLTKHSETQYITIDVSQEIVEGILKILEQEGIHYREFIGENTFNTVFLSNYKAVKLVYKM